MKIFLLDNRDTTKTNLHQTVHYICHRHKNYRTMILVTVDICPDRSYSTDMYLLMAYICPPMLSNADLLRTVRTVKDQGGLLVVSPDSPFLKRARTYGQAQVGDAA